MNLSNSGLKGNLKKELKHGKLWFRHNVYGSYCTSNSTQMRIQSFPSEMQSYCKVLGIVVFSKHVYGNHCTGHNLTGIASQFAMHLGFTCDVISVTHHSD